MNGKGAIITSSLLLFFHSISSMGWRRFIFFSFALTDHNIGSAQEGVNSCMKAGINSQGVKVKKDRSFKTSAVTRDV